MAKRLVEILIEMGILKIDGYSDLLVELNLGSSKGLFKKAEFEHFLMTAIATYQAEEIKEEMEKHT